jgi:DNA-binding NarL/FixJ family response regulator
MSAVNDRRQAIMVADADAQTRRETCELLAAAGHETLEAENGEQALTAAFIHRPALVILEVELPGICGYYVCDSLRAERPHDVSIIFVSATRTGSLDRVAGILLGADDYLAKPLVADELLARVGVLLRGRPTLAQESFELTPRELEVLALLADGLTQRQIALELGISEKTAGTHTEHIFAKLGVHSRPEAVALAHRHGLATSRPTDVPLVAPV